MIRIACADISRLDRMAYQRLYDAASGDRKARADRCLRGEDALRCVAAEALLRHALGRDAASVKKTPAGKPHIPERSDLFFNISHSGTWVVIAWGPSEVGVDVERIHRKGDPQNLMDRFFHPEERAYVLEREGEIPGRFCEIWTGKESYLKYLGTGLGADLRSFSILSPPEGVEIHRRLLPGDYWLSLCARTDGYELEFVDLGQL